MSFRTDLLALVDQIRGSVPGGLDLRQNTVMIRIRTWSGARVGLGTPTDSDTTIRNYGYNPKVESLKSEDVIASGGKYAAQDIRVGPLTPSYTGGGITVATLQPATTSTGREIFWYVSGPGVDGWFKLVDIESHRNFQYSVVLRATAQVP